MGLTRNPSKLVIPKGSGGADADKPLVDPNLTVIAGDVTNPADVAKGKFWKVVKLLVMCCSFCGSK